MKQVSGVAGDLFHVCHRPSESSASVDEDAYKSVCITEEADMATTSIRIDRRTHERLKDIAERQHSSLGSIVNDLLDRYEEEEFRRSVHESFQGLREDPAEWEAYKAMVKPWDATLLDGLEDEPAIENDCEE